MSLFALGVDVSTKATAMVVLDHTGVFAHRLIVHDTREQGARRLMQIRQAVRGALDVARWEIHVAAVENPANRFANVPLEQAGAVVLEAVQATYRGAIVLDPTPSSWQRDTIGCGKDAKPRSLAHARAGGFQTDDDNLSDAYCLAEYARELYLRDVLEEVA